MVSKYIIPTAEPFFFPGDETGCLLIHGFTGAPKEMRWLGEYLAEQGRTVLGIRLLAHATTPEDMLRARWRDWLASVEDGYHILSGCTRRNFLIGLSMGGVLSLCFAARFPVAGVVAMSTPHYLPNDWRLPYIKPLSKIQPRIAKGPSDWHDPEAERDHVDYPDYPTRALAELRDLMAEMNATLPQVTAPALLIHSRQDGVMLPKDGHADLIYDALGSTQKSVVWIEGSGHVITRDAARSIVFQTVSQFVDEISKSQIEDL
jgi:carboxylesterase